MKQKLDHIIYVARRNPLSFLAFIMIIFIVGVAIFGPYLVIHDPYKTSSAHVYLPPDTIYWFGTDQLGRDVFSRVVFATRIDLMIAVLAVAISSILGSVIGGFCGLVGGIVDRIVGRLVDITMAFPLFVLAIALVAALGNRIENIIYATAIINLPFYIRLTRSEVQLRRQSLYVDAAYLSGHSVVSVLGRVLLPNTFPVLALQLSLNMGWAIINAAGLSFIGLGISPPTAEWGIMVADGAKDVISGYWWTALFPGLALTLTVFCFNLMGDGLRDMLDPRMRT